MTSSHRLQTLATITALSATSLLTAAPAAADVLAVPASTAVELCTEAFADYLPAPSSEPLAACQWDMALIGANTATWQHATGAGVRIGVIDSGIDLNHPDVAPNLDVGASCSFIRPDDPMIVEGLADPVEAGSGDCSNKSAVDDLSGHGTHVASTIASPINGAGVAGVAPDATVVALKACTSVGYCFAQPVADALRYAGDIGLDIVNLSLFADPYLYYCRNDAEQRAILRELQAAARYAQQRGVLIVASAGNESSDLRHPQMDTISPDYPFDAAEDREVGNHCLVAPAELPGVLTVSATGPIGYPDYTMDLASYSTVGADVAAPGGDYFSASGTVLDAVLAALPADSAIAEQFRQIEQDFGIDLLVEQGGATYGYLNGTSMAAPHAAGVAALIVERHPNWSPGAVAAAVKRTARSLTCPTDWQPLFDGDERTQCRGGGGFTSFFGAGLVDAGAAARIS